MHWAWSLQRRGVHRQETNLGRCAFRAEIGLLLHECRRSPAAPGAELGQGLTAKECFHEGGAPAVCDSRREQAARACRHLGRKWQHSRQRSLSQSVHRPSKSLVVEGWLPKLLFVKEDRASR